MKPKSTASQAAQKRAVRNKTIFSQTQPVGSTSKTPKASSAAQSRPSGQETIKKAYLRFLM